jgi:hypothetical protein
MTARPKVVGVLQLSYHNSCTLCKGLYHVPTRSDFITDQATIKPPFCHYLHFPWCMIQRSLHVVTNVYYKSLSCFATVSPNLRPRLLAVLRFPLISGPSCIMWIPCRFLRHSPCNRARLTTYIASLISK